MSTEVVIVSLEETFFMLLQLITIRTVINPIKINEFLMVVNIILRKKSKQRQFYFDSDQNNLVKTKVSLSKQL